MSNVEPCKVCGSTESNLVDGYYYCVECGTQDANVRETVVEEMELADGTISYKTKKRIRIAEEEDNLSEEWHKWHTFNFILVGLADEMVALGAKPSFKKKLLWLWTRYIKKFQDKKELGLNVENGDNNENDKNKDNDINEENENDKRHKTHNKDGEVSDNEDTGFYDEEIFKWKKRPPSRKKELKMNSQIRLYVVKRGLFFGLIYIALSLDGSDFFISDLLRFVMLGKLDINNCEKFVPKEVKVKQIPHWETFTRSQICQKYMEVYIMTLYKFFELVPLVPNLKVLVHRYAKDLCLPNDFKNLVFSLMQLLPYDYLKITVKEMRYWGRIPLYECIVMSYFLVAFKMIFGLDDDYELRISDAVDKINEDNCLLKSYNLGGESEPTDRLFSFRDWCSYIQLRKVVLCKNYLHMAHYYQLPVDHYVYMEHDHAKRPLSKKSLGEEITMTLLGRISQEAAVAVIPISEFKATVTPLATATEVVMQYFNDPDLKLLFTEDFTQYSLKYATEKLYLNESDDNPKNILAGVSDTNKIINNKVIGCMNTQKFNYELVLVRNCENKNWIKTKQPSADHVTKAENDANKDTDHGYDSTEAASTIEISSCVTASTINNTITPFPEESNSTTDFNTITPMPEETINHTTVITSSENASIIELNNTNLNMTKEEPMEDKSEINEGESILHDVSIIEIDSKDDKASIASLETIKLGELEKELDLIEEEDFDKNIFDDDFADLVDVKSEPETEPIELDDNHQDFQAESNELNEDDHPNTSTHDALSELSVDVSERVFNEATFDREKTIRELVLGTCKKYKIRVPAEYRTQKEPRKRKSNLIQDGAGVSRAKKPKFDDGTPKIKKFERGKVKEEVNNLISSYFENLKHDVLFQLSEHVKSVVNNVSRTHEELNNVGRIQDDSIPLENSARESNFDNSINDHILDTENNTDPVDNPTTFEVSSSNLDQCSVQIVDSEINDTVPGDATFTDPRFDENEYDPKQLYVRVEVEDEITDVYDVADDPTLAAILDKKIREVENGLLPSGPETHSKRNKTYNSDDEDDVPLSVLMAEKEFMEQKYSQSAKLPPLLNQPRKEEYNYWIRQYETTKLRRAHEMNDQFYIELDKNFPRSFTFVLNECAAIIGYTPFRLYRVLLDLERRLLCYKNLNS